MSAAEDSWDIELAADFIRLEARLDNLTEVVDALMQDPPQRKMRSWWWGDLDSEQHAERQALLKYWVQECLIERAGEERRKIRECWPRHPSVVDDLTALYIAWYAAYRDPQATAGAALDYQDRWRPNAIRRIGETLDSCARGHTD